MNEHLWRKLYLTAHNPVLEEGASYPDLTLFSPDEYPALRFLQDASSLQILILAQLVLSAQYDDPRDRSCSEEMLQEVLEHLDCTPKEVRHALIQLYRRHWLTVCKGEDALHFRANMPQLIQDGLYIHNKWNRLHRLNLYGHRMCRN